MSLIHDEANMRKRINIKSSNIKKTKYIYKKYKVN